MANDMKVIVEGWRSYNKDLIFENKLKKFLGENTQGQMSAQQALDLLQQADEKLAAAKSENARKQWLGGILVSVMGIAGATIIVPLLGTFFSSIGVTGAFAGGWVAIKALFTGQSYSDAIKKAVDQIPPEAWEKVQEQLPAFIERVKGKTQDVAAKMIDKILDLKDEEALQSDVFKSIYLPDELDKLLGSNYEKVVDHLKMKLSALAARGKSMSKKGSLAMLNQFFNQEFGVYLIDPRFRVVMDR